MHAHRTDPHSTQHPFRPLTEPSFGASHRSPQRLRSSFPRRGAAALAAVAIAGATATTAFAATPNRPAHTPSQCILLNHGDYNACNVGNSGGGNLPYRAVGSTLDECIRANHGDYNACNVGNSGGGDLPYKPVD